MIYKNWITDEEVDASDAYRYVVDAIKREPQLMEEYKAAVVEWYFSGGTWMKEETR